MSSKKVDERVVEMRFDNSKFESNVKTSMSTLERLKQALNFSNSSKGLDGLSSAAKRVDFSGMAQGIDTVNARFSNLQVIGMTALSNITTAAMQAGKNLISSFTIDPIRNGFREYETQINAVQTIMANTQSKGTTMADVTAALDELNEYADMTIYNFSEMTKNIGTFTAAGVDLEKATAAIKGIANLGAMSGSTSAQVSTAMYQLSQALAAGRVSLMDWNSVVNAGMGGEQFQNALKRTAEHFGTDVDAMIEKYGSFRESLTQGGWLTAEVLTETLNQISGAYTEADLIAQGYTKDQAAAIVQMATTATDAATKVKTFSQLMQTLSEAAGSGWAKTWQLIFGDFEEAKAFFTEISDLLGGMINASSDARNSVIEGAMGGGASSWDTLKGKIEATGISVDQFQAKLTEVAQEQGVSIGDLVKEYGSFDKAITSGKVSADMIIETLKRLADTSTQATVSTEDLNGKLAYFQDVVDRVWRGDFKNAPERYQLLAEAGYDYAKVQELVNKTVDGHRLTLEDLSDAQLISIGYTQEEVTKIRELSEAAATAGTDINTLINQLSRKSGRELFLESLKNILQAIIKPLQAVSKAFSDVFGLDSEELYNIIKAFHDFTETLVMSDDTADDLMKTMRGLFSILHIAATIAGGAFRAGFTIANSILGFFGTNILEVTAVLGDALYYFDQWVTSGTVVSDAVNLIGSAFSWAVKPISEFFGWFTNIPAVSGALDGIRAFFDTIIGYFNSFKGLSLTEVFAKLVNDAKSAFIKLRSLSWDQVLAGLSNFGEKVREIFSGVIDKMKEVGPDLIEGLQNGLGDGVETIFEKMREIGTRIIEAICVVLGIHSPSTVMFEIGQNIVQGLINGIQSLLSGVSGLFAGLGADISEVLSNIDWGAIAVIATAAATFGILYKFTDALQMFGTAAKNVTAPAAGFGKILTNVANAIEQYTTGQVNGATKLQNIAIAIRTFAEAIAILSAAVVALTVIDQSKLVGAVATIGALAVIMGVLAAALSKFTNGADFKDVAKIGTMLLALSAALLVMSLATKIISGIEWEGLLKASYMIAVLGTVVMGLIAITTIGDGPIDKAAKFLTKFSAAFLILAVAAKLVETISWEGFIKAGVAMAGFTAFVAALVAISIFADKGIDKVGVMLLKVSGAIAILVVVSKLIAGMTYDDMAKAVIFLEGLVVIIAQLMIIANIGRGIDRVGGTLLAIAGAMAILSVSARLMTGMSFGDMAKAMAFMTGLVGIIGLMLAVTNLAPKGEMVRIAGTLLGMSLAIGIMAGIAVLLGMVRTENLVKGILAVTALGAIVAGLTAVTKFAQEIDKGTFIGLSIAIGVIAASLAVLSFIETDKLLGSMAALSTAMLAFAAIIASTGRIPEKSIGSLLVMSAAIAIIGGVLYLLASLPIESSLGASAALSLMMVSLSASMNLASKAGNVSVKALAGIGSMLIAVGLLVGIFKLMETIGVNPPIQSAASISMVLLSMSAALAIVSKTQTISLGALAGLAVMELALAGLVVIFGLMSSFDIAPSLETALALGTLLLAMSATMVILGAVGAVAVPALAGAAAMVGVIAIIAAAVAAFGAIQQIPGVDWIMSEGATFLSNLGNAIGSFVGSIAGGFAEGLTSGLPEAASNLSEFITNLQPFFDGLKNVDPASMDSLQSLGTALLTLTGANFLDAITSFISGGKDLGEFANQVVPLGEALSNFQSATTSVDPERMSQVAAATKTLVEAFATVPNSGGLLGDLIGGKDYSGFATGMTSIGDALNTFQTSTTSVDPERMKQVAEAAKTLIQALSEVPNTGGLLGDLLGGKDYTGFATGMTSIGDALNTFQTSTTSVDPERMKTIGEAAKILFQAMAEVPNSGGLLGDLLGGKDYSSFSTGLTSIGDAVNNFSNATNSIQDVESFSTVVNATRTLMDGLSQIQNTGGFLGLIMGGQDFGSFASSLGSLGTGVANFASATAGIADPGLLSSAVTATRSLLDGLAGITSTEGLLGSLINGTNFDSFKTGVSSIGSGVANFASSVAGVSFENVGAAVDGAKQILEFINSTADINTSGVESFKSAVDSLSTTKVSALLETFNAVSGDFKAVGEGLMSAVASGISWNSKVVTEAVQSAVGSAADAGKGKASEFSAVGEEIDSSIGKGVDGKAGDIASAVETAIDGAKSRAEAAASGFEYIGNMIAQGLASGIRAYASRVASEAAAMVRNAKRAAEEAGDVNSPSRVFYTIGGFLVAGMANALIDGRRTIYKSSYAAADSAREGLTKAVSSIGDALNTDMDFNPTIAPVLDLSNVRTGATAINSMLSNVAPMQLLAEVDGISRAMSRPNQNGSISDIVSSIDKLRRDISELDRNQYNINGITYDDGSNVSQAVQDLVRATRIEGRI